MFHSEHLQILVDICNLINFNRFSKFTILRVIENVMKVVQGLYNLVIKRITVSFTMESKTHLSATFGAYLRNGFMYFAHQIEIGGGDVLADVIERLPIGEGHPLYGQFRGGFPKGFFFDISQGGIFSRKRDNYLYPGQEYFFELVLIGNMASYEQHFLKALEMLMERGIGSPMCKLILSSIQCKNISFNGFGEFVSEGMLGMRIELETPLCLVKNLGARSRNSFQDKMNGFPSFYQLVRSVLYRMYTLSALYGPNGGTEQIPESIDEALEEYLVPACEAVLSGVSMQQVTLFNTPKKGSNKVLEFAGYMGRMDYENVYSSYYPLLKFAENFNVGNDIVYGLGSFKVALL